MTIFSIYDVPIGPVEASMTKLNDGDPDLFAGVGVDPL